MVPLGFEAAVILTRQPVRQQPAMVAVDANLTDVTATPTEFVNELETCSASPWQHGAAERLIRPTALVILLAGGDKSTQASDIKTALKLARNLGT